MDSETASVDSFDFCEEREDFEVETETLDARVAPVALSHAEKISDVIVTTLTDSLPSLLSLLTQAQDEEIRLKREREREEWRQKRALLPPPVLFEGVSCTGCKAIPVGVAYKCPVCTDTLLCACCEGNHPAEHPLLKIKTADLAECRLTNFKYLAENPEDHARIALALSQKNTPSLSPPSPSLSPPSPSLAAPSRSAATGSKCRTGVSFASVAASSTSLSLSPSPLSLSLSPSLSLPASEGFSIPPERERKREKREKRGKKEVVFASGAATASSLSLLPQSLDTPSVSVVIQEVTSEEKRRGRKKTDEEKREKKERKMRERGAAAAAAAAGGGERERERDRRPHPTSFITMRDVLEGQTRNKKKERGEKEREKGKRGGWRKLKMGEFEIAPAWWENFRAKAAVSQLESMGFNARTPHVRKILEEVDFNVDVAVNRILAM